MADYTGSADWVELTVFFNGDGTLNMDELGPDAVGFFIEDAALGLVLASAQTPQLPVNNAHRTKSFTALKATAASVGLVGFEDAGFVFTVRDIVVEVNWARRCCRARWRRRSIGPAPFPASGDRLSEVETGDPDNPVLIDFRGTPLVGFAAAHVVLEIGDNVFVSGAFSFRMGEVETVQVEPGGLLPLDITDLNVRTIKVGAEGVSVFLGDGLADYDIDEDLADYLSTDTPAVVLVGETVGNLVDGKIYRRVGSVLGSVGGPALDLAGQDYFDASVWRPVAADFVGGQTAAVAVGETVGVFDAAPRPIGCSSGSTARWRAARCRSWWPTTPAAPIGSS